MRNTIAAVMLLLAGCDRSTQSAEADGPTPFGQASRESVDNSQSNRDLVSLKIGAEGERGGRTYADFDKLRDTDATESFKGFGCLGSCAGHEAGYAWGRKAEVMDPDECGGKSWSFTEGCVAAALENTNTADDPYSRDDGPGLF